MDSVYVFAGLGGGWALMLGVGFFYSVPWILRRNIGEIVEALSGRSVADVADTIVLGGGLFFFGLLFGVTGLLITDLVRVGCVRLVRRIRRRREQRRETSGRR